MVGVSDIDFSIQRAFVKSQAGISLHHKILGTHKESWYTFCFSSRRPVLTPFRVILCQRGISAPLQRGHSIFGIEIPSECRLQLAWIILTLKRLRLSDQSFGEEIAVRDSLRPQTTSPRCLSHSPPPQSRLHTRQPLNRYLQPPQSRT